MANNLYISYSLTGLLLLASACSQEASERGRDMRPGGRIEFRVNMPQLNTRATEITGSSLTQFQVSAFTVGRSSETLYFPEKTFIRDSGTGVFFCHDEKCIWPNSSDSLRFIAFYPSCEEMAESGGAAALNGDRLTGFRVATDIASQFDFITAIAGGSLYYNEETGITLGMEHQLSRVFLKAWGNSGNFDLEIAGVRIGGIGTDAIFSLAAGAGTTEGLQGGSWENVTNGYVEYIYREGDVTVTLDGTDATPDEAGKAVSILGARIGGDPGYENSAMVIPTANPAWDYKVSPANGAGHHEGKYISVLLRVTDDTPYDTKGAIVYPPQDNTGGDKTVYLAVDKEDRKTVKTRLYKYGDGYFTDPDHDRAYDLDGNGAVVKDYAWAALPVQQEFLPGRIYTYTLNYTNGVGLRAPDDSDPGTPVISDKVLVNVEVAEWKQEVDSLVTVPRR